MYVNRQNEQLHAHLVRSSLRVPGYEVGPKIARPAEMLHFPTLDTFDYVGDTVPYISDIRYTEGLFSNGVAHMFGGGRFGTIQWGVQRHIIEPLESNKCNAASSVWGAPWALCLPSEETTN